MSLINSNSVSAVGWSERSKSDVVCSSAGAHLDLEPLLKNLNPKRPAGTVQFVTCLIVSLMMAALGLSILIHGVVTNQPQTSRFATSISVSKLDVDDVESPSETFTTTSAYGEFSVVAALGCSVAAMMLSYLVNTAAWLAFRSKNSIGGSKWGVNVPLKASVWSHVVLETISWTSMVLLVMVLSRVTDVWMLALGGLVVVSTTLQLATDAAPVTAETARWKSNAPP